MPRHATPSAVKLIVAGFWLGYIINVRLDYGQVGLFEIAIGLLAMLVIVLELPLYWRQYRDKM